MIAQQHTSLPSLTDLQAAALALYLSSNNLLAIATKLKLPFHKLIDLFNQPELKAYTQATQELAQAQLDQHQTGAKLIAIDTLAEVAADKTNNTAERRRAASAILRPTRAFQARNAEPRAERSPSAPSPSARSRASSTSPTPSTNPSPPSPPQSQLKTDNRQLRTPLPSDPPLSPVACGLRPSQVPSLLLSPTLQSATNLHPHLSPKLKRRFKTPKSLLNHFKTSNLRELLNCTDAKPDQSRGTTQTYKITTAQNKQKTLTIKLTRSPTNKNKRLFIDAFKLDSS